MIIPSSKRTRNQKVKEARKIDNPLRQRLYPLKEAAGYLGRSEWSMRELIWAGKIPVVRTEGGRKIFVDIEDLDDFIRQNKSPYL